MAATSLSELFVEELRDMYDGEKRLTKALPKMARAAESAELEEAFTSHLRETETQITRLEQVFRSIGEKPRGKQCHGIMGIVEEGSKAMDELNRGPVLDAALIAGAQKAEHYEIASYGTLAYFAELLGHDQGRNLLGETLDEEKAADEKLTQIAASEVNRDALASEGAEAGEESFAMRRTGRRMGSSTGTANDRSSGRSSRRGGSAKRGTRSSRKRS